MSKKSEMNTFGLLKCQIDDTDQIPFTKVSIYRYNSKKMFTDFYAVCEKKHITKYIINPPQISSDPSDIIAKANGLQSSLEDWKKNYPSFFRNTIGRIYSYFEQFVNYFTLEYLDSASFSLRTLYERIVYENFGVWVFYPNLPSIHRSSSEYKCVNEKIKKLGFQIFILVLISSNFRKKISNNKQSCIEYKGKEYEGERLKILREITENTINYKQIGNEIISQKQNLQNLQHDYDPLSSSVHGYKPISSVDLQSICEHVLKMYNDFFNNSNSWGVYDD